MSDEVDNATGQSTPATHGRQDVMSDETRPPLSEGERSQISDRESETATTEDDDSVTRDEEVLVLAELLGFALSGRPERVEDGMLALAPPPFREGVRVARETIALLGRDMPVEAPTVWLRDRIIGTVARRLPRCALVIIDMIHDHLDPGALLEVPRAREVVGALKRRIESARARGMPVVYVVDEHEPDDPDLDAWGTHAVKGTKGTEVWGEIAPASGDRIVKKPSYSAFFESNLDDVLEELRIDTLVLTGCLTEIGIMATATDAMQRGYAIEVPPDSQAGSSPFAEAAAMGTLRVMAPFGPARKERLDRIAA
jgi:nicotinamidase/pyrazinamidase